MDDRVKQAALGALRRLGATAPAAGAPGGALRLDRLTLAQLSNLAYLQAEDPLVAQVALALRDGRPVHLDRPAVERALGLGQYPPRMQEQFARWFSRISGYGVHLDQAAAAPVVPHPAQAPAPASGAPAPPPPLAPSPEREILADILGERCTGDRPCVLEPGKGCCGSGRCKSLGF